jgi:hypothetical protein
VGRLHSLVLAATALAVLVAGGWWWVESAPDTDTGSEVAAVLPDPLDP